MSDGANHVAGVVIGFIGWSFAAFLLCWFLLSMYDYARHPLSEPTIEDHKTNGVIRVKYAALAGLFIGFLCSL